MSAPVTTALPPRLWTAPSTALLAAAVTVLLWASAFVGIRAVGADFSPGPLTLARLLVGSLVLGGVVLVRGLVLPRGRQLLFIVLYGLLWFAGYNIALNAAEQTLDAGTAAMLVQIAPIIVAILAGHFLKEGFPPRLFAGSAVALLGAVIIAAGSGGDRRIGLTGVLVCLLAGVLYAAGMVAQKPVLRTIPALQATWLGCTVGLVACLPFGPSLWTEVAEASTGSILGLIYLGVFPTAVAFTTWAYALSRTPAGQLGATTYLVPVVAAGMSWVLLDEVPPALSFLGGALCLVGVAFTRLGPRRSPVKVAGSVGLPRRRASLRLD
ncbi:MAG: DMT family transporter [Geodermatophilaceae bacterium]|jgi:drug/metabolite transporter (DMT)-like permease